MDLLLFRVGVGLIGFRVAVSLLLFRDVVGLLLFRVWTGFDRVKSRSLFVTVQRRMNGFITISEFGLGLIL